MSEQITKYLDLTSNLKKIDEKIKVKSDILGAVQYALDSNPTSLVLIGQNGSSGVLQNKGYQWPTAKELQDLANEWTKIRQEILFAWEMIPFKDRNGLIEPKDL